MHLMYNVIETQEEKKRKKLYGFPETIQLGCKWVGCNFWGRQMMTLRKLGNLIMNNSGWINAKCWVESDEMINHIWLREFELMKLVCLI